MGVKCAWKVNSTSVPSIASGPLVTWPLMHCQHNWALNEMPRKQPWRDGLRKQVPAYLQRPKQRPGLLGICPMLINQLSVISYGLKITVSFDRLCSRHWILRIVLPFLFFWGHSGSFGDTHFHFLHLTKWGVGPTKAHAEINPLALHVGQNLPLSPHLPIYIWRGEKAESIHCGLKQPVKSGSVASPGN